MLVDQFVVRGVGERRASSAGTVQFRGGPNARIGMRV
jgi:hypothetical protein